MAQGYKRSVYIPQSYRGNALELERACVPAEETECKAEQGSCPAEQKRESNVLSRLFSSESGNAVILLVLALLLLGDGGRDKKEKCPDDTLLYLGLLLLLLA